MDDINVNLVLPVRDINALLAQLCKLPYADVHDLVGKIKSQGDAVMAAVMQKVASSAPAPANDANVTDVAV